MSIHIESKKEDIANIVLMPGDPNRAKYIAENYLDDYKLVNTLRGQLAYTGYFNNKRVTVMSSGMGIPSIGIYAYELFKFYDVDYIIRIGTAGSLHKDIKLMDVVLATSSYSRTNFPLQFDGDTKREYDSSKLLNEKIIETSKKLNKKVIPGKIITSEVFDVYVDIDKFESLFPDDNFLACEMEAFCLFYLAKKLGKQTTCLISVVDSKYDKKEVDSMTREKGLNDMIEVALNSVLDL